MKKRISVTKYVMLLFVVLLLTGCGLTLKMPSNKDVVNTLEPTFKWEYADKEDLAFELKMAEDPNFEQNTKLFKIKEKSQFTLTIPYLKPGKQYYWTVRAIYYDKKAGEHIYSDWVYDNEKNKVPYLFTTSQNAEGNLQLEEGQPEEVNLSGTVENVSRLTFNDSDEWAPAVSENGEMLAFVSNRNKNEEIFVKNLAQGGTGEMQRTFSSAQQNNLNPFWVDNVNFGFYSNRLDKKNWKLFTSTEGKGLTLVSPSFSFIGSKWLYGSASDISDKIVFTSKTTTSPQPKLWLFESSSNRFTQLVPGLFPEIHKNDIAFCSNKSGNYDIWKMELKGNSIFKETQLTYHEDWDYDPAWSPDGERIAYVSHRSGNSDIWVIDKNGANEMQVTFHPMADRRPQWVDNTTLIFQSNREVDKDGKPQWDIWQIKISE